MSTIEISFEYIENSNCLRKETLLLPSSVAIEYLSNAVNTLHYNTNKNKPMSIEISKKKVNLISLIKIETKPNLFSEYNLVHKKGNDILSNRLIC